MGVQKEASFSCWARRVDALLVAALLLVSGCGSTGQLVSIQAPETQPYQSGDLANKGYRQEEATQFIEFCVELDSQDDRLTHAADKWFVSVIDPTLWTPMYDSRRKVADDVFNYFKSKSHSPDEHWAQLYALIIKKATHKYPGQWNADTLFSDPDLNGFGPWQNAWLLYEGRGKYAGAYAIAIRGTVFSNAPSATEDAWFHTVKAKSFLSPVVQFTDAPNASLHSGFAHATFTALLDDRYGILRILTDLNIPANARLYIVGHSQGAAMATIVHAFMHYAMRADERAVSPAFGLKGKNFKLKSYGFAQPKPGDNAFSADFARITQSYDNAIVINNSIDAVPMVPMTLQAIGDLGSAFRVGSTAGKTIQFVSSIGSGVRRTIALFAEPFVKSSARGYSYFYNYKDIMPLGGDTTASTWDFSSAGHVLFVYGTPGNPNDVFLQHHAWTYRNLIRQQLSD